MRYHDERTGFTYDLEAGTFTCTLFGSPLTRPLSPTVLAKMRAEGCEAVLATAHESRLLPKGQKHGSA